MSGTCRVGVIGDLHCEDQRLSEALRVLGDESVDLLAQVGDIVDGLGDVDRCISLLQHWDVKTVRGNHERWFMDGHRREKPGATQSMADSSRAFLANLETTHRVSREGGDLLFCHGVGDDDMVFLRSDTRGYDLQAVMPALVPLMVDTALRYVIAGHTHERMVRDFEDIVVINAGTLHDNGPPGFILVDFDAGHVRCWDFDGVTPREVAPQPLP